MVLTKRKHNWSDTDLALRETTTNHERSKLEEVTGELEVCQAKTKQVRFRYSILYYFHDGLSSLGPYTTIY